MNSVTADRVGSGGNKEERSAKRARRNEDEDEEGQPPLSSDPFSNLPPDALTIVLKYACPSEDIHRFEFAWSIGKISKSLRGHRASILDMLHVVPFHLEEYEEYSPLNGTSDDREPFDCRAALVKALSTDPAKCALISELHITRQSIEKPDGRIGNGMVKSLRSLLTKEGAFENAKVLSMNLNPVDLEVDDVLNGCHLTNISLFNKAMLKKMPKSFPSITNITLGHCFPPEILQSGNLFSAFFHSLRTPLRSLALLCIPGLTESHVANVLSTTRDNLTRLEIDGGRRSSSNDAPFSVTSEMFNALVTNGKRLESLSLCGVEIFDLSYHPVRVLSSIAGLKELVLKRNGHHFYTRIDEGYEEIPETEAEQQYIDLFLFYGKQLEAFRGDFSSVLAASDALDNLVALQLSDTEDAAENSAPNIPKTIKLQEVDLGLLHKGALARAIRAGVRDFEMSEETEEQARNSNKSICVALLRRGGFRFPHEVVFRFSSWGKCFYVKAYARDGAVKLSIICIEVGAIGSNERTHVIRLG